MAKANFPDSIWDGTSSERKDPLDIRRPGPYDWAQGVAEIIALESYSLTHPSIVAKGFVLGASNPVTTGNNKLPVFTAPGDSEAILKRVRLNALVNGSVSIRINPSLGTYSLGFYDSIDIAINSGTIITVDVLSADGTVKCVTGEMEFFV